MSVRISVESLSGCAWNGCPSQRGIRKQALVLLRHLSKTRVVDEEEKGWMFVSPIYPGRPANLASMLKSFQHIWPEIAWVLYPHPGPEADYEHKFTWLLVTAKAKFESLGGDAEKVPAFFYIALSKCCA